MTNLSKDEILRKIKNLEDKIYDCKAYIVSDFCVSCSQMYDNIKKYQIQIDALKELYNNK
jgi:hypothetical protein